MSLIEKMMACMRIRAISLIILLIQCLMENIFLTIGFLKVSSLKTRISLKFNRTIAWFLRCILKTILKKFNSVKT